MGPGFKYTQMVYGVVTGVPVRSKLEPWPKRGFATRVGWDDMGPLLPAEETLPEEAENMEIHGRKLDLMLKPQTWSLYPTLYVTMI